MGWTGLNSGMGRLGARLSLPMSFRKDAPSLAMLCLELGLSPTMPFRKAALSLAMPCL